MVIDDNIRELESSFEVIHTLFGKVYKKKFSFSVWGNKVKALSAADNHASKMRAYLSTIEEPCDSNIGIRCIHFEIKAIPRKRTDVRFVYYKVYFTVDGSNRSNRKRKSTHGFRTFIAGVEGEVTGSDIFKAFLAARRFRRLYEYHKLCNIPFNHEEVLRRWKTKQLDYFLDKETVNVDKYTERNKVS